MISFAHRAFPLLWGTTLVDNIGTWTWDADGSARTTIAPVANSAGFTGYFGCACWAV